MKSSKVKLISLVSQAPDAIFHKAANMVLQEEAAKNNLEIFSPLSPVISCSKSEKTKIKRKISRESHKRNRRQKK